MNTQNSQNELTTAPHDLDRYSAVDRAIGRRITRSFGEWVALCQRSDQWSDKARGATLENVKTFLPDYAEWQDENPYYAVISDDLNGPAYGVGKTKHEARAAARSAGFDGDDETVVRITADSFDRIRAGNPNAVELAD